VDDSGFEARAERVQRIDAIVRGLDPSIRAQAFELLGGFDGDIEAIVFLVLMNAAEEAQEDLRSIMAEVRAINHQKSKLRDMLETVEREDAELAKRLRCEYDELFVSTQDELGEVQSLRLQMALDRRSKFLSTLSNLLKKLSDTESSIIQNLK
jgi:hypothetical protein